MAVDVGTQRPGPVLLSLRFESIIDEPGAEDLAVVLEDLDSLYRSAPAAVAFGAPWESLINDYRLQRLRRMVVRRLSDDVRVTETRIRGAVRDFERGLNLAGLNDSDQALKLSQDLLAALGDLDLYSYETDAIGDGLRIRRLKMASPLDLVAVIPWEYVIGGSFLLFLTGVEKRFNMAQRIRTEQIELAARQAARRADQREAELREQRAVMALEGLRTTPSRLHLVEGKVSVESEPADGQLGDGDLE